MNFAPLTCLDSLERLAVQRFSTARIFAKRKTSDPAVRKATKPISHGAKYSWGAGFLALASLLGGSVIAMALPGHPVLGTYYVSNSGSDSNNGTSPTTPWQTLAKVSVTNMAPGSAVYLRCGSVFRESLQLWSPGSATAPINIGSYGNCTKPPKINGADLLTAWTSANEGTYTAYSAPEATAPAVVFEDNHRLLPASSISTMAVNSFFYDANHQLVYVRLNSNTDPGSHSMEASVRAIGLTIEGVSYVNITGIEVDKATQHNIEAWGSITNVTLTGTITNYSYGNGIFFTANGGQSQNNILIQNCTANYNGEDGIMKANFGNNFIIQGCTANYNAFDMQYLYTGGIRFIDGGGIEANRAINSGAIGNSAAFNGINPDTGAAVTGTGQEGTGVWCDTCGNGSFLTSNIAHDNAQNGIMIENSGANNSLTMSYNIAYNNSFAGIFLSRASHNDVIANNTAYNNFYNCQFSGTHGGTDTTIGMVNNIFENNICSSQVIVANPNIDATGASLIAQFGAENNTLGQGSGNIYRNNSFGAISADNGVFAVWGLNAKGQANILTSYAAMDAAYGSSTNSMQSDPMLASPTSDFGLQPNSPAIGAGRGGLDLGAVPYVP